MDHWSCPARRWWLVGSDLELKLQGSRVRQGDLVEVMEEKAPDGTGSLFPGIKDGGNPLGRKFLAY
ncbi:MAG: hypothetical protein DF168_00176 [Candidatus Moanabacter tarae]|uniref:Uncharacterized protein n=1 Tax=Candidatus Moanibacter tarae TaxID=2200854 RepID=A0A2Z4AG18_9BACT|nr:MAG: hypothetical protein DF168_00176 [Candidatus Moanabacter tarae]